MTRVTCVFPSLSRTPFIMPVFQLMIKFFFFLLFAYKNSWRGSMPKNGKQLHLLWFRGDRISMRVETKKEFEETWTRRHSVLQKNRLQKPSVQSGSVSAPDLNCYSKQMWFLNTQTLLLLRFPEHCFLWVTIVARGSADRPDGGIGSGCGAAILCINMRELAGSLLQLRGECSLTQPRRERRHGTVAVYTGEDSTLSSWANSAVQAHCSPSSTNFKGQCSAVETAWLLKNLISILFISQCLIISAQQAQNVDKNTTLQCGETKSDKNATKRWKHCWLCSGCSTLSRNHTRLFLNSCQDWAHKSCQFCHLNRAFYYSRHWTICSDWK